MTAVKKFLFDTSFDVVDTQNDAGHENGNGNGHDLDLSMPEVEEVIEPTFSEAEMAAAREEGFAAGKAAALQEAAGSFEQQLLNAIGALARQLSSVIQGQEQNNVQTSKDAVTVATTLVHKLFPSLNDKMLIEELETMVRDTVSGLMDEPNLIFRLSSDFHGPIEERLRAVADNAGYDGRVKIIADDALAPGDCRIEWGNGGVERSVEQIWAHIDRVIESNLGQPSRLPDPAPESRAEPPSDGPRADAAPSPEAAAPTAETVPETPQEGIVEGTGLSAGVSSGTSPEIGTAGTKDGDAMAPLELTEPDGMDTDETHMTAAGGQPAEGTPDAPPEPKPEA